MIQLGHIEYSNCIPVHAQLLEPGAPGWVHIRTGVPSELNRALARGEIDVAPCSSIEYARHAGEYLLLPEFTIASRGPVQSIRFETCRPPDELAGATIAVPSASATSIVLLRILLERRWNVQAEFTSFEQAREDPFAAGAAAALWIGDVALRRHVPAGHTVLDLGEEWYAWTGLPFAFAVWQARRDAPAAELARLRARLIASRHWFRAHEAALAERYASRFQLSPERLRHYWSSLVYDLDAEVRSGLLRFLAEAAALGEAPPVTALAFVPEAT